MNEPKTVQCAVHFEREARGRKRVEPGAEQPSALPPGRVPRLARFLALALRLEAQLRQGVLKDCAEVARVGHVTRARVSQILTLVNLAPDIQEAILFLPRTQRGRDPVRSEEHTSELQSRGHLVCRLLLEKKKTN